MRRPTFDQGFSTKALTDLYSPASTVEAILEFEAALALALADTGLADGGDAEQVAAACRNGVADADAVLASAWESGTPIIALREALGAGETFHFGATTQDAIDSGQMLQASRALEIVDGYLSSIAARLSDLTAEHRNQPQMGRTFLQDARPTTFGFRSAGWLDAVLDGIADVRARRAAIPVQLGGPVGTLEAYGEAGTQVVEALAGRLGLKAPDISWQANRNKVLVLAQCAERVARTMAKIGSDVSLLASSQIAEVTVRTGGSSSMPDKRNPIDAIRAIAAATACSGAVAMLTSAPPGQLERPVGAWHTEWLALPLTFQTAGAAAEAIETCLGSLRVDVVAMSARTSAEPVFDPASIDRVLERHRALS
jgi:3-carboxy-cis,cis-muconate cycloisomerase